jgi:hypothetical protein
MKLRAKHHSAIELLIQHRFAPPVSPLNSFPLWVLGPDYLQPGKGNRGQILLAIVHRIGHL